MKYAYIRAQQEQHRVGTLCRLLGVSIQGYYAWKKRPISRRAERDAELSARIRVVFAENKQCYGSPRVHDELKDLGIRCGRKRVERLMRQDGLVAKAGRKYRVTTDSSHDKAIAPDLVQRQFKASRPNELWVGDITYLWTAEGWLYLTVFIDMYSRIVVGWATGTRLAATLVTTALARAVARRRPKPGIIIHTDQGVQYASDAYRRALAKLQVRKSMGSRGDCWDNAAAESFFHSFKIEAVYDVDIETRREMEYEVFDYIERFYNKKRKHSALGLRSPVQFETESITTRKAAA